MATGRIGTTPVLTTRWSKAPSAGTTSLSGLDDNSVSLVYSVGYEAVYQNGVLLSRGNDYTATNGTTITLTTATVAGDIIEVFANQTIPLTDTYSQTVSDGRFIKNTLTTTTGDIIYASAANTPARLAIGSTDQVLKVSGGVPAWGAAPATLVGCSAYRTTNLSVSNGATTSVGFDSELWDTDGFHDTSTNTERFTIPSGKGGKYLVTAGVIWDGNSTGYREIRLHKLTPSESNLFISTQYPAHANSYFETMTYMTPSLAAGDYLILKVEQNSGGTRTVSGSSSAWTCYFEMIWLGA